MVAKKKSKKVRELESANNDSEEARRLAAVLLDSSDAVIVWDFEGKITAWNRGASRCSDIAKPKA